MNGITCSSRGHVGPVMETFLMWGSKPGQSGIKLDLGLAFDPLCENYERPNSTYISVKRNLTVHDGL